jgi:hypothetical protein
VRRIDQTTWECLSCGEQKRLPYGAQPHTMMWDPDGGHVERVIFFGGRVLHRCVPNDPEAPGTTT